MENSFYLFLLVLSIILLAKLYEELRTVVFAALGVSTITLVLSRPEAIFVIIVACSITIFGSKFNRKIVLVLIGFLTFAAAGFLVRPCLGLDWFPSPVYAKIDVSLYTRVREGISYVISTTSQLPISTIFGIFILVSSGVNLFYAASSSLSNFIYIIVFSFVCSIGLFAISSSDWMEAGRFFSPAYFLLFLLAGWIIPAKFARLVVSVSALLFIGDITNIASRPYGGIPLYTSFDYQAKNFSPSWLERRNTIHARDIIFVDELLDIFRTTDSEKILVATNQGGFIPYHLFKNLGKKISLIEISGLSSRRVQNCVSGWKDTAYRDLIKYQQCLGTNFEFVFDLDNKKFDRLNKLLELGCHEVFRKEVIVDVVPWKRPLARNGFLVDCRRKPQ